MTDTEQIILSEIKEVRKDVKSLVIDVTALKVRAATYGGIAGIIASCIIKFIVFIV